MKPSVIFTYVYNQVISSPRNSIKRRFWSKIRKILIRSIGDFAVEMIIHERHMLIPMSHELPIYLSLFPRYDRLPKKISGFILKKYNFVRCIDVGANIGDTIAAFFNEGADFLAIEPNPHFVTYLKHNWKNNQNVIVESILCSSVNQTAKFEVLERRGTAQVRSSEYGSALPQLTLDTIVELHPEFNDANILKIDTDGFDFEVIRGAISLIERNKPAVLFECDKFDNKNYVADFFQCAEIFIKSGYKYIIVYDHLGSYMGTFDLESSHTRKIIEDLLKWQESTDLTYFDILFMEGNTPLEFLTQSQ